MRNPGVAPNLDDLSAIGISPAAFRYYLLTAHYRSPLDLSLEALRAADTAFERLSHFVVRNALSAPETEHAGSATWRQQFYGALYEDFDAPRALATIWCIFADASLPLGGRARLIAELGGVLGLQWKQPEVQDRTLEPEIAGLLAEREQARRAGDFPRADALRAQLAANGFAIVDGPTGTLVTRARSVSH